MENRNYLSNFLISLFVGFFLLFSIFFSYGYLGFNALEISLLIFVSVILYGILLFTLIYTSKARAIRHRAPKPIAIDGELNRKEPLTRSDNDIINAIVKEVYSSGTGDLPDNVEFIGSTESKIYHETGCSLADKIEAKHRLENNSEEFFKRRKFKKCKSCFKK